MESKCAATLTCPIWSPIYATVCTIWSPNIGPSLTKMESLSPSKIMSVSLTLGTLHRLPSSVSCTARKRHPSCARQLPPWQRLGTSTRSPTDAGYLKPYSPLNPIRSTYKTSTILYGAFALITSLSILSLERLLILFHDATRQSMRSLATSIVLVV